ncbi:MAG TPA: hypothetical protein VHA11_00160 [Bryobacteraceae bacterium]|nr:hypothetical protein [Bryobacteraceae bacterium]
MIVVFANEHDQKARWLVRRWRDRGALLMVPSDLSRAGWRCTSSAPAHSEFVIGGVTRCASEIDGVLIRWPAVVPADLPYIAASDRNYVAAEMNAFLVYWLTASGRRVLNRPTPRSLCGPGWYPEHWVRHASQAGLRVRTLQRSLTLASAGRFGWPVYDGLWVDVIVAGPACYGSATPELARKACALAAAAGVELVKFRFDGSGEDACFLEADVCPNLEDELVEQAVYSYLETGLWPAGA